jgi:phosphomannomutase/phosphoglucomutase
LYKEEVTPAFALDLGRALGTMLEGTRLVVGGDPRPSTPRLKGALIEGLMETGCYVLDLGLVPTSALYFTQALLAVEGAVMVTASHNPSGYNGFKLQLGRWPATESELQALQAQMETQQFRQGQGYWGRADVIEPYQTYIRQFFPTGQSKLRVVVDAGNGCMSEIAPTVLKRQGYAVVERFCQIDGRFPNRNPNPAVAAHLAGLAEQVVAQQADIGVAYDGDGDRVVFVDDTGHVLPGDRSLLFFIRHRLATARTQGERTVVYDIKCSRVVAEEIERGHGIPRMERSGHAFIKSTLIQEQAGLGGEISGHYFFGELQRDDALFATLLMLQIVFEANRPLSALVKEVPRYPITPDIRLPCAPAEQEAILAKAQAAFADHDLSTIDGVRIEFDQGWALMRSSVTEPLLTLRFEAYTEDELDRIQAEVSQRVPALEKLLARSGPPVPETVDD